MKKLSALSMAVMVAAMQSPVATAGTVTSDGADIVIKTKGGLKVSTADKKYSIQFGGRFMYDYDLTETDDATTKDDFSVRRARLYAKGDVGDDWSYKLQFNIGNGVDVDVTTDASGNVTDVDGDGEEGGSPEDLYIRYKGFGPKAIVTLGRQKMPFGMEQLESSKDISILERGATTEYYDIGRKDGVVLSGKKPGNITYALGLYEGNGSASSGSDDTSFAARVTFAPINEGGTVVHLGAAYKNEGDDLDAFGVELAAASGPLHFQSEFFDEDNDGESNDAYYAQLGYVLTGESRPYKNGVFKRVKPTGDCGAVELVARYEDGYAKYSDVGLSTVEGNQLAIGLNWYVTNAVKIAFSYMDAEEDDSGIDGQEYRARFQLAF